MKSIIVTVTGQPFESYHVDMRYFDEFKNDESGEWDAIPGVFVGRPIMHRGQVGDATILYGIDVRKVTME